MIVPHMKLEKETLRRVIEEFVTREGTDYGHRERDLATKIDAVLRGLDRQEYYLCYDEKSDSCNIITKQELRGMGQT